eukprot:6191752-Pleurochrysis_carterae.AAC.1
MFAHCNTINAPRHNAKADPLRSAIKCASKCTTARRMHVQVDFGLRLCIRQMYFAPFDLSMPKQPGLPVLRLVVSCALQCLLGMATVH